ncbi:hypothetical protein EON82_10695 [bacterium]|nr:MAG: hypothetical protein EON82_10695 [bacterium]
MSLATKIILCSIWGSLIALGFGYAWRYEATQGVSAAAKAWPERSGLKLGDTQTTLVLFAHPNCPCTLVSVNQLGDLLGKMPQRPRVYCVIVQAPGLSEDLSKSSVAAAARKIDGATSVVDRSGAEAKRFGAATSGQVFAFNPEGKELFRGGVTAARGHYGPNDGIDALSAVLSATSPKISSTPVYGCSLLGASL